MEVRLDWTYIRLTDSEGVCLYRICTLSVARHSKKDPRTGRGWLCDENELMNRFLLLFYNLSSV
jgi:hypothetical protein